MKRGKSREYPARFGARLRLLRYELDLDQIQFAGLLGCPATALTAIERGVAAHIRLGSLGRLIAIALQNGFSLHWLLAGVGLPKTDGAPNRKVLVVPEGGEAVVTVVTESRIAGLLGAGGGGVDRPASQVGLAMTCAGITEVQIAEELNCTRQAVSLYVTGARRGARMQARIWRAFCELSGKTPALQDLWGQLLAPAPDGAEEDAA